MSPEPQPALSLHLRLFGEHDGPEPTVTINGKPTTLPTRVKSRDTPHTGLVRPEALAHPGTADTGLVDSEDPDGEARSAGRHPRELYEELRDSWLRQQPANSTTLGPSLRPASGVDAFTGLGNRPLPRFLEQDSDQYPFPELRSTDEAGYREALDRVVVVLLGNDASYPIQRLVACVTHSALGKPQLPLHSRWSHKDLLRYQTHSSWALGLPPENGGPYIPRVAWHAERQGLRPLIDWEVDTGRKARRRRHLAATPRRSSSPAGAAPAGAAPPSDTRVRRTSPRRRSSYLWDVVFGRAALREEPPYRVHQPSQGSPTKFPHGQQSLAGWARQRHNRARLDAASSEDSWIPWVLAYAHSVGIPRGRIVYSVDAAPRRRHRSLSELQADACRSWRARGILDPADFRDPLTDAGLIDRLFNGMCPHRPWLEPADTEPGRARLLWTFTWAGPDHSEARYPQDGVYDLGQEPQATAKGRMPDVEVRTAPALLDESGHALQAGESLALESIILRWGPTEELRVKATPGDSEPVPGPRDSPGPHHLCTRWTLAKWFVRQAILVAGQIDWHLARCHIYVEQLCAVLCRYLRQKTRTGHVDHLFLQQLWPFLRSADEINAFGDLTLLSGDGVLSAASCLSYDAAVKRLRQQRASWRWDQAPPRGAMADSDLFGVASGAAWEACQAFAQQLMDELSEEQGSELTNNSELQEAIVRVHTAHHGDGGPAAWWGKGGTPDDGMGAPPVWAQESSPPRFRAPKSLGDWQYFAAHIVYSATFLHSWVGGAQATDMGNVFVASSGHRWSHMPLAEGERWSAEQAESEWARNGPVPDHAGFLVSLAELIGVHELGRLGDAHLEVETDDAQPPPDELAVVQRLLRCLEQEWNKLDSHPAAERLRPGRIRSRINI